MPENLKRKRKRDLLCLQVPADIREFIDRETSLYGRPRVIPASQFIFACVRANPKFGRKRATVEERRAA